MSLPIPAFLQQSFRYASLDQASRGPCEDWKSSLSPARLIGVKRFRLAAATTFCLSLFLFFVVPRMFYHLYQCSACPDIIADTDWSQFAYSQFVTDSDYLCNSVMALEALDRLGSKAARILMYPFEWSLDSNQTTRPNQLLRIAETLYKATLIPVQVQRVDTGDREWSNGHIPMRETSADVLRPGVGIRHLGRKFYKAPCLQSNPVQTCPELRLRQHPLATHV